jgi:hypothetical protein
MGAYFAHEKEPAVLHSQTPGQTLDDRRKARADLAYRLQKARDDLSGARHDAVQAALAAAGDAEQSSAEDKIHRAEIHALTLENALLAMDVEIADAAEAERVAADQSQRKATAGDLEQRAALLEKAAVPLAEMLAELKAALDGCVPVVGEIGMPGFVGELIVALPDGASVIAAEMRARGAEILAGRAPASLPKPFVPQIVAEPPKSPTISIFALENLSWKGERGQQIASAFTIMALPADRAQIAMKRGLAILPDSERAQAIIKNPHGLPHILDPAKMHDLDRDPRTVSVYRGGKHVRDEPGPQVFEQFDRGPARSASWVNPHPEPTPGAPDEF